MQLCLERFIEHVNFLNFVLTKCMPPLQRHPASFCVFGAPSQGAQGVRLVAVTPSHNSEMINNVVMVFILFYFDGEF